MPNPTAAMLVVGDEILSGRTRDANMHYLAGRLDQVGIELCEARIVSDRPDAIVKAIRALSSEQTHLFTSGGIGPTHDDITADCVAEAMGVSIDVRRDARTMLEAHYARQGIELNAARLRMARIPDGAKLIENPISGAPGFSLENVHVMAGVPTIFQVMVDTLLPRLTGGSALFTETITLKLPEGEIAGPLASLVEQHATVKFGCYPFFKAGEPGANIVLRSAKNSDLAAATDALHETFKGALW